MGQGLYPEKGKGMGGYLLIWIGYVVHSSNRPRANKGGAVIGFTFDLI